MVGKHFPNINALNFIAACVIILFHLVIWPTFYGKEIAGWYILPLTNLAHISLSTFFVLFGFLVTYKLLCEREATGTIATRYFYIRRIRRVWPVYYLTIIICFFILPNFSFSLPGYPDSIYKNFWFCLALCLVLLPNVALKMLCPANMMAGTTWIIGIEEPMYFLWPWLIRKFDNLLQVFGTMALASMLVKALLAWMAYSSPADKSIKAMYDFWNISSVTSIPIGGAIAWIYFDKKKKYLNIIYDLRFRVCVYCCAAIILLTNVTFPFYYEFFSLVIAVLVLNMATNDKNMINIEWLVPHYFSRIVYGFYFFHIIVMALLYNYITFLGSFAFSFLVYVISLLMGVISYELVEKRFLKATPV